MNNNFSQHVLMLETLIFNVAYMSFSMLQTLILNVAWTVRWEIVPSDVRALASPIVLNKLVEEFILVSTSSIHNDKSWRWQL